MESPTEEIQKQLKAGDLAAAISATKAAIRKAPTDGELRFMLFQTLSLSGDWEAASNQLVAYSELTGRQSPLPIVFNQVIQAEVRRKHVFLGEERPTVFGEPPEWIPFLIQSLAHSAKGEFAAALELRERALAAAPAVGGTINGQRFDWMMDGDSRISVVFEAIINGSYYWVPQSRIRSVLIEPPVQARDAVWAPAQLVLENEAPVSAYLPSRYPGAGTWRDDAHKLARRTDWEDPIEGFHVGRGQRVFMTESSEYPILDIREIEFNPA